jgi:membrane dipeptidase
MVFEVCAALIPMIKRLVLTILDALEQIDVSVNLIQKYSDDFQLCRTADEVEDAIRAGKIASLFGLEG